jgi:hypothetical protein
MTSETILRTDTISSRILDASAAGRSLLIAADAAAQRTLLSVLSTAQIVAAYQPIGDYATGAEGDLASSAIQPGDLATVATTGAYSDLSGLPSLATVATTGSYDDLSDKPTIPAVAKVYIQVALSPNGAVIAAGTGKGFAPVTVAGTITAFSIDCDPNNEPSDQSTLVDLNKVARDTGTVTSVLSSVATIATGANTATGTINGTQTVAAGDMLQLDVDQGSDGQDLIATIEITPS